MPALHFVFFKLSSSNNFWGCIVIKRVYDRAGFHMHEVSLLRLHPRPPKGFIFRYSFFYPLESVCIPCCDYSWLVISNVFDLHQTYISQQKQGQVHTLICKGIIQTYVPWTYIFFTTLSEAKYLTEVKLEIFLLTPYYGHLSTHKRARGTCLHKILK